LPLTNGGDTGIEPAFPKTKSGARLTKHSHDLRPLVQRVSEETGAIFRSDRRGARPADRALRIKSNGGFPSRPVQVAVDEAGYSLVR
jgi:hypothetical protein